MTNRREAAKKGEMWRVGQFSWVNGSRTEKAMEHAMIARRSAEAAEEIRERIAREGPWPTALRLTVPFTNPNYRSPK